MGVSFSYKGNGIPALEPSHTITYHHVSSHKKEPE